MEDSTSMEVLTMTIPASPNFFSRVFSNDAAKKGLAGAIAGMLVAVVTEVLWPNNA
jgi:hypothetical protein